MDDLPRPDGPLRACYLASFLYGTRLWPATEKRLKQSPTSAPPQPPMSEWTKTATSGSARPSGGYAKRAGYQLVDEFNDAAVSGADPIETRPGFAALLDRIEDNGVRTVIVEDASRFARELVTQELGILALIKRGVRVLTANGDDLTDSSDPSRKMMRQIAGSFAEYEKARLVAKLKAARERKRLTTGKCEGRKSHAETNPEMVRIAKGLRRRKRGNSLRAIAAELAARGYVNANGREFSAASVASMLGAKA